MKKGKSRSRNNGDRIYKRNRNRDKTKTSEAIEKTRIGDERRLLTDTDFSGSYIDDDDYSHLELLPPEHLHVLADTSTRELSLDIQDTTRETNNQIECQIVGLDLNQETQDSSTEQSIKDSLSCNSRPNVDDLLSISETSDEIQAVTSRKRLLDRYIVQKIGEGSSGCGCSFDCVISDKGLAKLDHSIFNNLLNNSNQSHHLPLYSTNSLDPGSNNYQSTVLFDESLQSDTISVKDTLANKTKRDDKFKPQNSIGNVCLVNDEISSDHRSRSLVNYCSGQTEASVLLELHERPHRFVCRSNAVGEILEREAGTIFDANNNNSARRIDTETSFVSGTFADEASCVYLTESEASTDEFETSNVLESLSDSTSEHYRQQDIDESSIFNSKTGYRANSLESKQSDKRPSGSLVYALDLEHRISDWAQYQRNHQEALDCSLTADSNVPSSWSQEFQANISSFHGVEHHNCCFRQDRGESSRDSLTNYCEIKQAEEESTRSKTRQESILLGQLEEDTNKSCATINRGPARRRITELISTDILRNDLIAAGDYTKLDGGDRRESVLSCCSISSCLHCRLNKFHATLPRGKQKTIGAASGTIAFGSMDKGDEEENNASCSRNEANSMRAAKDIAKMSIPSLSALQYLPSQMDAKKMIKKHRAINNDREATRPNAKIAGAGERKLTEIRVITESCEDFKHDESCLLERICLCNCMARSQQQSDRLTHETKPTLVKASSDDKLARRRYKRSKSPSHSKIMDREGDANEDDSNSRQGSVSSNQELKSHKDSLSSKDVILATTEEQKQSPSFLNLLKTTLLDPRESWRQSNKRSSQERRRAQLSTGDKSGDSYHSSQKYVANPHASVSPASTGTRESYSPQADSHLDSSSKGSSSSSLLHIKRGQKHSSKRPSSVLSDEPLSSTGDDLPSERSQSAFSTSCIRDLGDVLDVKEKKQKQDSMKSYKKYLTSGKLFSNKSDSNQQQDEASPSRNHKSFFTRSLNRLSHRRDTADRKSRIQAHGLKDSEADLFTCGLDSELSISNSLGSSRYRQSNAPANSLESINLDHSSPPISSKILVAPAIVLNTVEHVQSIGESEQSKTPMTRAGSYRCDSSESLRVTSLVRQLRYGSDFLDDSASNDYFDSDRTNSRSSSPGGTRRRQNGGTRSPRLRESPVPFRSPATESTKIEDGLRVCSIEHFEKHIGNIKDNQMHAQRKLFKAWINHFCNNLIQHDLVEELRDGIKLVALLAYLTRDKKLFAQYEKLQKDKMSYINRLIVTPSSRLKHLSNVSISIDYLRNEVGMKLINLNPMDIVSGKPNVILGLCWNLILHFQLEQNFLKYLDSCDGTSERSSVSPNLSLISAASDCTSRLSSRHTSEDGAKIARPNKQHIALSSEEYTAQDLVSAKKKLLRHTLASECLNNAHPDDTTCEKEVEIINAPEIGNVDSDQKSKPPTQRLRKSNSIVKSSKWNKNKKDSKRSRTPQNGRQIVKPGDQVKASGDEQSGQWSFISWLLGQNKGQRSEVSTNSGRHVGESKRKRGNNSRFRPKSEAEIDTKTEIRKGEPKDLPLTSLIWMKLKRAYRNSIPLNIILLICLAGICIVPLLHRDACCELSQSQVTFEESLNIIEKPT